MRETLPDDFQTAEYLREHGMVDMVVPRLELAETVSRLLNLLMNRDTAAGGKAGAGNPRANGRMLPKNQAPATGGRGTKAALKQAKEAQQSAKNSIKDKDGSQPARKRAGR